MTTQSNSSSPFQSTASQEKTAPEEFSIRTMKDDLARLQKEALSAKEATLTEIAPAKIMPAAPKQEKIKPSDIKSEEVHPFVTQPNIKAPVEISTQKKEISKPAPKNNSAAVLRLVSITAISLIVFLVAVGGYYFWLTKKNPKPTTVVQNTLPEEPTMIPIEDSTAIIATPTEKHSASNPNYLTLNALDSETIKTALVDAIEEIKKSSNPQTAHEFILVDSNNSPIPIKAFSTATKLGFSSRILADLGTQFSLFIYNDNDEFRLALVFEIKDSAALKKDLAIKEKTFISDSLFLFLDAKPELLAGSFSSSNYNGADIRYFNANTQGTLSIDYTINNSKLIIGTSKNTLRTVLDRISKKSDAPIVSDNSMQPTIDQPAEAVTNTQSETPTEATASNAEVADNNTIVQ